MNKLLVTKFEQNFIDLQQYQTDPWKNDEQNKNQQHNDRKRKRASKYVE